MRIVQRLVALLPKQWAVAIESESREWMLRCTACGHERSVWEAGGVRYKAKGRPKRLVLCPYCGRLKWHQLYKLT